MQEEVFAGRSDELDVARRRLARAADRQAGVLWVEAPAGMGKSAFLRRVLAEAGEAVTVTRVEADDLAGDQPFDLVAQIAPVDEDDPFAVGLALLEHLSERQGDRTVVVVVEDVHWADPLSMQALLVVARRLRDDRVLLVFSSRPGPVLDDGWERLLANPERTDRVVLNPLTADEVFDVAERSGRVLDREGARRLQRHTGGHPLHVRTLLEELTDAQLAGASGPLPAPTSLAATVVARIAALPEAARSLAQALAVLDDRVPLPVLGQVAAVDDPSAALEQLLKTNVISSSDDGERVSVSFQHPLHRAAVLADLSPTRRRWLHVVAADVVGGDAAFRHRYAAADGPDPRLAAELVGRAADATASLEPAATFLLWAATLTSGPDADAALLDAMDRLIAGRQLRRADPHLARLTGMVPSGRRDLVLGELAWLRGDYAVAESYLAAAGEDPDLDDERRARALVTHSILLSQSGRAREGVQAGAAALGLVTPDTLLASQAAAALATAKAHVEGGVAGVEWLAERLPPDVGEAAVADRFLLGTRGVLAFFAGRYSAATLDLRAVLASGRPGQGPALPRVHLCLAHSLIYLGEWDEALVHAHVALSLVVDEHHPWLLSRVHGVLTQIYALRGRSDEAAAHLADARRLAAAENPESMAGAMTAAAMMARVEGRPDAVIDLTTPYVEGADGMTMLSSLTWWLWYGDALIDLGRLDEVDPHLERLSDAAQHRGLDLEARILDIRGRLAAARGRRAEAVEYFDEAGKRAAGAGNQLDGALRAWRHGEVLAAMGQRDNARSYLSRALDTLVRLGAEPFVGRVEADLQRLGATPIRSVRAPLDLTDRESDVAALVAKGLTNREVAATLYVSEKAVEYHLSNIFGKLGIRSRRALRADVQAGGAPA